MNVPNVDWLSGGEGADPAIVVPGGPIMTYAALRSTIERLSGSLRAQGVAPGDRVALVLPGGLPAALGFLAASSAAAAAPLNPAYREDEFRFYLDDLGVRALVTARGHNTAVTGAVPGGILHFELDVEQPAPTLNLLTGTPARRSVADSEDGIALVLHTSGTTARPKMVPLTVNNLAASARNIIGTLGLSPADRCLNVMPLFHIHGLVAGLLAPLASGGSVVCPAGFDAFKFAGWVENQRPTWYTAVPTMHQVILQRIAPRPPGGSPSLRFIRSSSSSLPPVVLEELEARFGVPVVEAYGMTEAAHQITSNPLPPGRRKPGSVGTGHGVEIRVIDESGAGLPDGATGEVAIQGPNVMGAYVANAEANAQAFVAGWFRTGDEGFVDGEGYLHLTGRLKEIINRGGEKISPREVDEVLLRHPAVAQAVAFAIPHALLGEDVGAAVVLRKGSDVGERELRGFAAERLAAFKVPKTIMFLDQIPKGPTGKVQRVGLAARLGIAGEG
jgi:acyl-CoA synthetase (AMP-forming)/AMP-acid ligase II